MLFGLHLRFPLCTVTSAFSLYCVCGFSFCFGFVGTTMFVVCVIGGLCGVIYVVVFSLLWWLCRGCMYLAGGVVGFGVGCVVLLVSLVSLCRSCCVSVVLPFSCNLVVTLVWFLNCSVSSE